MRSPWRWRATCPPHTSPTRRRARPRPARRRSCATTSSAGAACRGTTSARRLGMKERFRELSGTLEGALAPGETLLCNLSAERSDFVRFNKALVRQAGSVTQSYLSLRLARERRQAAASIALAGNDDDFALARSTLARLRETLRELPEDPWLLLNEAPQSGEA